MQERRADPAGDGDEQRRTRTERARERGRGAGARAAELRQRQLRLRDGTPSTPGDVAAARQAAVLGLERAEEALEHSIAAHGFAAQAHDRVARYLEQLARSGGPQVDRWLLKAHHHRAAAMADRDAEEADQRLLRDQRSE